MGNYNEKIKTDTLFGNVITILKLRRPSLMDILYLKKSKQLLVNVSILKPTQAFRLRVLCNIKITPKMCMDEVDRLRMFMPGSPSFYDQCWRLQNPKVFLVPKYHINDFARFLSYWELGTFEHDFILYDRFERIEFGEDDISICEFFGNPSMYTYKDTYTLYSLLDAPKDVLAIKYSRWEIKVRVLKE